MREGGADGGGRYDLERCGLLFGGDGQRELIEVGGCVVVGDFDDGDDGGGVDGS